MDINESQDVKLQEIKVFISSPKDVESERKIILNILSHLERNELSGKCIIKPFLWENRVYKATKSFQGQIEEYVNIAKADIFIAILHSRIGTRIEEEGYKKNENEFFTGTEYEINQALVAHEQSGEKGKPHIFIFHKNTDPTITWNNKTLRYEEVQQYNELDDFITEFENTKGGTRPLNKYTNPNRFEALVKDAVLQCFQSDNIQETNIIFNGNPFQGLNYFNFEHAPIFFGRKKVSQKIHLKILNQIENKKTFLLVGGSSGIGKSSFVRAGVLPLLFYPLSNWRFAELRAIDMNRGNNWAEVFAKALTMEIMQEKNLQNDFHKPIYLPSALPELLYNSSIEDITKNIQENLPSVLGEISATLRYLSIDKQMYADSEVRLCLLLDQLEEFFTTKNLSDKEINTFFSAIRKMAENGQVVVIATMRADCLAYCENVPDLQYLKEGDGYYHLSPISSDEISNIVCTPAKLVGVGFEKNILIDNESHSLDELIIKDAIDYAPNEKNTNLLPMLEFVLTTLYLEMEKKGEKTLSFTDYKKFGGIKGVIVKKAQEIYDGFKEIHRAVHVFSVMIGKLIDFENDKAIRKKALLSSFKTENKEKEFVNSLISARLLYTEGEGEQATVSLAHDSLLTHWDLLSNLIKENREIIINRKEFEASFKSWIKNKRSDDDLLRRGRQFENAENLRKQLENRNTPLSAEEKVFINRSRKAIARAKKEKQDLYRTIQKFIDFSFDDYLKSSSDSKFENVHKINSIINQYYREIHSEDNQFQLNKCKTLIRQGDYFLFEKNELQTAKDYYLKCYEVTHKFSAKAQDFDIQLIEIQSLKKIGYIFELKNNSEEAIGYYSKALSACNNLRQISDEQHTEVKQYKHIIFYALAGCNLNIGDKAKALSSINEAIKVAKEIDLQADVEKYSQYKSEHFDESMTSAYIIRIYLVAGDDLQDEYYEIVEMVESLNKVLKVRNTEIELIPHGYGDIEDCELCFVIYNTNFGEFGISSFENALESMKNDHNPKKIYVYFKETEEISLELKEFKEDFAITYGHFFRKFTNVDGLMLEFLMQIELCIQSYESMLKVESEAITVNKTSLIDLNNIPFIANNDNYTYLKDEIATLTEDIYTLRSRLIEEPDNEYLSNLLQRRLYSRNEKQEKLIQLQENLFDTAKHISKINQVHASERLQRGIEAFERGDVDRANIILGEIVQESVITIDKHKQTTEEFEKAKTQLMLIMEASRLRADVVLADNSTCIEDRVKIAKNAYIEAIEIANKIEYDKDKMGDLLLYYANFLSEYAFYDEATKIYNETIEIYNNIYGSNNEQLATAYNNIALVYSSLGDYYRALEYLSKSLAIREELLGKSHVDTATTYNNIGLVYDSLGDFDKALGYLQKALTIREKVLGEEDLNTASSYSSIGLNYEYQGDFDNALEYQTKALIIQEKILDWEHADIATSYNNIGQIYQYKGDYDKALEYYAKALSIYEKTLGTEHPTTAKLYNSIGTLYDNFGEFDKALEFCEKALGIYRKVLGIEHPETAMVYNTIAHIYSHKCEYDKTLKYYDKALGIYQKVFGSEHPDTATSYGNIGYIYFNLGEYDKALEYQLKTLEIKEKVFGSDYPSTAGTYNNIATIYFEQGNYEIALEYYKKTLSVYEKIFGADHPQVISLKEKIQTIQQELANKG